MHTIIHYTIIVNTRLFYYLVDVAFYKTLKYFEITRVMFDVFTHRWKSAYNHYDVHSSTQHELSILQENVKKLPFHFLKW